MITLRLPPLEDGGAPREVPFVIGVIGDFSGDHPGPRIPLRDRKFLGVDRDDLDAVLRALSPAVVTEVDAGGPEPVAARLGFASMDDFEPARIARRLESLVPGLRGGPAGAGDGGPGPAGGSLLDRVLAATGGAAAVPAGAPSRWLAAALARPEFRRLEAAWRGLRLLVQEAATGPLLKIAVLDASKADLARDLEEAEGRFDGTELFRKVVEEPLEGPPSRFEPFGVLLGDLEFTDHPADLGLLAALARTAAAASCPFVAAAGPGFLGLEEEEDLPPPGDLERILQGPALAPWRSLRDAEESRHLALVLPRVLARRPHRRNGVPGEEPGLDEIPEARPSPTSLRRRLPWMSPVHALGARIAASVAACGWPGRIAGFEGGGRIEGLPAATAFGPSGDAEVLSAEFPIDEVRSRVLARGGLIPLLQDRGGGGATFFEVPTVHRPRPSGDPTAAAAEAIRDRLPCVLTVSRLLQAVTRLGEEAAASSGASSTEAVGRLEERLDRWIAAYAGPAGEGSGGDEGFPLREGRIEARATGGAGLEILVSLWPAPGHAGGDLPAPLRSRLRFS